MPTLKDVDTGELHVVAVPGKRQVHTDPFTMVFCEELLSFTTDPLMRLTALQWTVLMHLVAVVAFENVVDRSIAEVARATGFDRSSVSRALAALEDMELLRRDLPRGTRPRTIYLDPRLCFRGGPAQRARMLRSWPPAQVPEPRPVT